MIVALAGRKGCGKSTGAKLLLDKGFQKASFAAPLKEYVGKLYNWNIALLNSQDGKEELLPTPATWNKEHAKQLSDMIGTEVPFDRPRTFINRREALQYIGTDVLRAMDEDFHIKEFKKKYGNGDNFVNEDLRFGNENALLKEMGAVSVFLIRPYYWDYSNHASEVSLSRHDFDNSVMNDRAEKHFINLMEEWFNALIDKQELPKYEIQNRYQFNHDLFSSATQESAYWAGVIAANGQMRQCSLYAYTIDVIHPDIVLLNRLKEFLQSEDLPVRPIRYNNSKTKHYYVPISSPYLIEDLKLWNIDPNTKDRKIPDIIKNNDDLLNYWNAGIETNFNLNY